MDITPVIQAGRLQLQSYGAGRFVISGKEYAESIILSPQAVEIWQMAQPVEWSEASVLALLDMAKTVEAEVVLVGTGPQVVPLPPKWRQLFREARISLDVMDTGAACRTYNVLLAEERRLMAALCVV